MRRPPPFDIYRAAFYLLALVIVITLVLIAFAALTCTVATYQGMHEAGTCIKVGIADELHNLWTEMLTAILALLLAGRRPPPEE